MTKPDEKDYDEIVKDVQRRRNEREQEQLNIGWYFWLISELPGLVIFLCLCLTATFTAVSIVYSDIPDFSDPAKGFEVRGVELSDRLITWQNMINQTGHRSALSYFPSLFARTKIENQEKQLRRSNLAKSRQKKKKKRKRKKKKRNRRSIKPYQWNFNQNGYFCDNPRQMFGKMTFTLEPNNVKSIWTLQAFQSICTSENRLLSHIKYADVCYKLNVSTCCPTMSLPNYVAYLTGVSSCEHLTQRDLDKALRLLRNCEPFYCDGKLTSKCWQSPERNNQCPDVPKHCTDHNAVFSLFYYLLEKRSVCSSNLNASVFVLRNSAAFLPALTNDGLLPIYDDNFAESSKLSDGVTRISGIDFGIDEPVFERLLYTDSVYPIVAMLAVLVIIFLYTGSLFITTMNFASTASAMCVSYFFYTIVFDFKFFPFLNLTAVLVMVGLSADNVLVFYGTWRNHAAADKQKLSRGWPLRHRHPSNARLGVVAKATVRHVSWSLLVTGLTTSAAFLSNYSSSVTAIKCFGVYAGLTVLTNLFFSLTWLPATIIFDHKYLQCLRCRGQSQLWSKLCENFAEISRIFFHQIQVLFIVRLRYFWMTLYFTCAVSSLYVVFVYPGLRLPQKSQYFQFFKPSHPFEVYNSNSGYFAFQNEALGNFSARVVFGLHPVDNGDHRDPTNKGVLMRNIRFNVSSRTSQRWLLNFCKDIRESEYYQPSPRSLIYTTCFIEMLKEWMESQQCTQQNMPCCDRATFPYRPHVFQYCLKQGIFSLSNDPRLPHLNAWSPGPRFDSNDVIRAVVIEFPSNVTHSSSYEQVERFYKSVDKFLQPLLSGAPSGMQGGWFVSDFEYFALQSGLYYGTITSVGLSLLVAQIVILVTSRNVAVSLYANFTIACVIFVTSAILVLLGWELNVLESVTISIAVGLSVDFTAHYAIAYIVCKDKSDRARRVETTASRMGPAITLAALTTFIAGVGMLPSSVLAYNRFGVFLMIVMVVSWMFSTYFFLPMLSAIGPQGTCCDIRCGSENCKNMPSETDEQTTMITSDTCSMKVSANTGSGFYNHEIVERSTTL